MKHIGKWQWLGWLLAGVLLVTQQSVRSQADRAGAVEHKKWRQTSGEAALYKQWRKGDGPAVVHFYADWCGVCRRMAPEMSALTDAYGHELPVIYLDVDTPQGGAIAEHHGVSGLPHTEFFAAPGELSRRFVGYVSRHKLFEAVAPLLPLLQEDPETGDNQGSETATP